MPARHTGNMPLSDVLAHEANHLVAVGHGVVVIALGVLAAVGYKYFLGLGLGFIEGPYHP